MTREEFIKGFCQAEDKTWDELSKEFDVIPCACGEEGCKGWQIIPNSLKELQKEGVIKGKDNDFS